MLKFVCLAIFAFSVTNVFSTPIDDQSQADADLNKSNSTIQLMNDNKDGKFKIFSMSQQYPYSSYPYIMPMMYPPSMTPYPMSPYMMRPNPYTASYGFSRDRPAGESEKGKTAEGKTLHLGGGLRPPVYYQAQQQQQPHYYAQPVAQSYPVSQPVIQTIPVYQSYQPHYQQPHYQQSAPTYVSYPLQTHSNYYRSVDGAKIDPVKASLEVAQPLEISQPSTIVIKKVPSSMPPKYTIVYEDAEMSDGRDASSLYENQQQAAYTAIPYSTGYPQIDELRRDDIAIDNNYNMQIRPTYLMDRLRLQATKEPSTPFLRDGEESSMDNLQYVGAQQNSQIPPVSPDDRVYVVMNPYSAQPGAARAPAATRSADWQNSFVLPPPSGTATPYSHESINNYMLDYYGKLYNQQMAEAQANVPKGDLTGILKEIINNNQFKGEGKASSTGKDKDVKEMPKADANKENNSAKPATR